MSIDDQPFFILNYKELEVVYFEKVTFLTKTFDCIFIFEHKGKQPVSIN